MIFFSFTRRSFLKRLFYMIHMLKPGLCQVEYILSIRGLFLPTVSWNLADGKYIIVDDYHVGRATWYLSCLGFLFEHVPFLNYASTGKTQQISIFVLNLIIGLCGIFKQQFSIRGSAFLVTFLFSFDQRRSSPTSSIPCFVLYPFFPFPLLFFPKDTSDGHIFCPLVGQEWKLNYHRENFGVGEGRGEAEEPFSDTIIFYCPHLIFFLISVCGKKDYLKVQYVAQ